MGKAGAKKAEPAKAEAPKAAAAAAPKAAQEEAAGWEEPQNLWLFQRPSDIVYSGVYFFLAGSALFSLYAGCHGEGVKLSKMFDPVCEHARKYEFSIPLEIQNKWNKQVGTGHADEFMHYAYCLVNILFALPLGFVMLFGARANNWQKNAIVHATALLLINGYGLAKGWGQVQPKRELFEATQLAMTVAPVMMLYRWWGDYCFTAESHRGMGVLTALINVYAIVALGLVLVLVYDWLIESHSSVKHLKPLGPVVNQYTKAAQKAVQQFGKVAIAKVNELFKK